MGSWLEAIETSILHVNDNSFAGPLIIGTYKKLVPGPAIWSLCLTRSVLYRTALWGNCMDTVALVIYYHEAAMEAGSKFVSPNSPTVHFDATPAQSTRILKMVH